MKNIRNEETGAVDVSLAWEYTYLPASAPNKSYPLPTPSLLEEASDGEVVVVSGMRRGEGTMQSPLVSSGKLFEPHVVVPEK